MLQTTMGTPNSVPLHVLFWFFIVFLLINIGVSVIREKKKTIPAIRACLPGPQIKQAILDDDKRKCLVIGDSISIGYTNEVQHHLQGKCSVYHAPWDIGDGGALDTKHGIHCLSLLMTSSKRQNVTYDVIVFNFGLHDINCEKKYIEEFTSINEYSKNLKLLKDYFLETKAKVAYALTTPVLDDCDLNDLVERYNEVANDVMTTHRAVDVINLYKVIVDLCGPVPSHRANTIDCPITNDTLIPHYTPHGYKLLAKPITTTIKRLLQRENGTKRLKKKQGHQAILKDKSKHVVHCKTDDDERSVCPANSTCVKNHLSGSGYACCLSQNAVDCKTGIHCCPVGTTCSHTCTKQRCNCVTKL